MNVITNYLKAHVALIGAVGTWLVAALKDGQISGQEWTALPIAVATGLGVALVPNRKTSRRRAARDAGEAGLVVIAVGVLLLAVFLGLAVHPLWFLLAVLCLVVFL